MPPMIRSSIAMASVACGDGWLEDVKEVAEGVDGVGGLVAAEPGFGSAAEPYRDDARGDGGVDVFGGGVADVEGVGGVGLQLLDNGEDASRVGLYSTEVLGESHRLNVVIESEAPGERGPMHGWTRYIRDESHGGAAAAEEVENGDRLAV